MSTFAQMHQVLQNLKERGDTPAQAARALLYAFAPDVDGAEADVAAPATRNELRMQELAEWWRKLAESDIAMVVPKTIEYGAGDLAEIGHGLARLAGRDVENDEAVELGIYFYVIGKLARWTAAVNEGRRPSDDTLLDIKVYTTMAQRAREAGGWPGV